MSSEMLKLWADPEFLKMIRPPSTNGAVASQAAPCVNGAQPRQEEIPLLSSTRTGYPPPRPPAADTVPQPTHRNDTDEVTRPVHANGKPSESAKASPPPKDHRVAQLAEESRKELSDELDPDTASLVDRKLNGPMIEEYHEIRREIQDYLNNIDAQNATSKDLGDAVLKAWAKAIYDVGELRRVLSSNVVVQHREFIEAKQKELKQLNKELKSLKDSNDKVEAEVERIEHLKNGLKWADRLHHLSEVMEIVGTGIEGVAALPALAVNASSVLAIASSSWGAASNIDELFDYLAKNSLQVTIALEGLRGEGFSNAKELEEAIKRKLNRINDTATALSGLIRRRDRAQKVYDTAVSESPKK